MIRRAATALLAALALASPAFADTIGVLKANTLVLHEADGGFYTLLISDGGEMEQVNPAGIWASGVWDIEGGKFCWQARGAAKLCIAMPADKAAGDSWDIAGPTGKVVWIAEILEGRTDLDAIVQGIQASKELEAAAKEQSRQ